MKILLVIDNFNAVPERNAQEITKFISDHFSALGQCRTIFTTQVAPNDFVKRCDIVEVEGLSEIDGISLMRTKLGEIKIEDESLIGIVRNCGGNPQILLTSVLLLKKFVSSDQVIESLRACEDEWFTEFHKLVWSHLSPEIKTVVLATSLFSKSVSIETLERVTGLSSKRFNQACRRAYNYSLIERYKFEAQRVSQHELVRCVAKHDLELPKNAEIVAELRQNWRDWVLNFSAEFERDTVWNRHSRLQLLEDNEFSDLIALQTALGWFKEQGQYLDFLELSRNLRYFYYTRGFWELERDLARQRGEVAQRVNDEVEMFDSLLYHLNVACKQENLEEVKANFVEMERLWTRRDIMGLPDLKRIEYGHVRALIGQLRKYEGWEKECLKLWEDNLKWLEGYSQEAAGSKEDWNSFNFHYNVNLRYLANHHFEMQNWPEARELFQKALRHSQEQCFERGRILVMLKLAALDIRQRRYPNALNTLSEVASSVEALKDVLAMGQMNMLRGDALAATGDPLQACFFYRKARDHFQMLEHRQCLERVERKMEKAMEARNSSNA